MRVDQFLGLQHTLPMVIYRWRSPIPLHKDQALSWLNSEHIEGSVEVWRSDKTFLEHRHFWNETLVLISGELIVNIAGNQVLLGPGDRIDIPANTKHSYRLNTPECEVAVGLKF